MQNEQDMKNMDKFRTILSNERTMLSYVRTAFSILVTAVLFLRFMGEGKGYLYLGLGLTVISVIILITGLIIYVKRHSHIRTW
jgi:uncharacterized membrane protein YidH (DUF202 family)